MKQKEDSSKVSRVEAERIMGPLPYSKQHATDIIINSVDDLHLLVHRLDPTDIPEKENWQKFLASLANAIKTNAALIAHAPEMDAEIATLTKALKLYIKLDNDNRAGCEIGDDDWAECHQAGMSALARSEGGE